MNFTLTGDWEKLKKRMNGQRFEGKLKESVQRATEYNALLLVKKIRNNITGNQFTGNARLTVLIKHSSRALVDDGDLFGAITHRMIDPLTAFVGILRTARDASGHSLANIAEILHEGASIAVTEKMRGMFWMLYRVGQGLIPASELEGDAARLAKDLGPRLSEIRPLKASTRAIVVPPRDFIARVFKNSRVIYQCRRNWEKAVDAALHDKASGGGQ